MSNVPPKDYYTDVHKAAACDSERALSESQARLATFAEATFEGIVETEEERIIDCNQQYARILGYSVDELRGMDVRNLIVPEDLDRVIASTQQECDFIIENSLFRKDGTRVVIEAHSRPIFNSSNRRFTAIRDITSRKCMEAALRESEERYRALVENSPDLITRFDRDLRMIYANPGVLQRIGKPIDELVGRTALEYGENSVSAKLWEQAAHRALEIGLPRRFENTSVWQGQVRIYDIMLIPESSTDGTINSIMNVARDITERKRAEEALRTAYGEMEVRVEERTADLKKLNEALSQSNMALEDFAHVASHDLQEPLRKIMTFSERLIHADTSNLNDQARDYLARVQQAAQRMHILIQDLVKYSRVTSSPELFKVINLKNPVKDAATDLTLLMEENDGLVQIGTLPDVKANETQMRQLFQNLIGNALKYRSDEKPVIRIYNNQPVRDGLNEIHVEDNGIGFDEQFLDKIFKPFQRLHGKSSPIKGTGMGLAICRKIVDLHGGSITAKSEPGKGSTFIVRLPKPVSTEVLK